jgi:hypothetical protein
MNLVFAVYVPRSEELVSRLFFLSLLWIVLAFFGRREFGWLTSFVVILFGGLLAVLPELLRACSANLGQYGDICREWNHSNFGDGFWAAVTYFHVEWGSIHAIAGMICGLFVMIIGRIVLNRRNRSSPDRRNESTGAAFIAK